MRRLRLPALLVALALLAWWLMPQPLSPVVQISITAEPIDDIQLACALPDEPENTCAQPTEPGDTSPPEDQGNQAYLPLPATLRCPIPLDVQQAQPAGTVRLDRLPADSDFNQAIYESGALLVRHYPNLAGGTLYLEGYAPADLTFFDGNCTIDALVQQAAIAGTITPIVGAEAGQIALQGCGANVPIDRDGSFFAQINPGPCALFAVRQDGALSVRSDVLYLDPRPGEELLVELALPTWHAASAGLTLSAAPDGLFEVSRVAPNSPADHLDLRQGDLVVAIDGQELGGLPPWDVQDLSLGPSSTNVTYTVLREGALIDLLMRREPQD